MAGLKSVDPNAYEGWDGASGCKGCELDVDNMAEVLSSAGAYAIDTLKTQQATASAILNRIESAARILKSGDMFVFYFSGHGGRKTDTNADEADEHDETLVAFDREILDDELAAHWAEFAAGVRTVMLSDSCNSGTNASFIGMSAIPETTSVRPVQKARKPIGFTGKIPGMQAQLIHFGACRDGQASAGYRQGSAFTLALHEIWDSGRYSGTYREFYEAIENRLRRAGELQEPQFTVFGDVQTDFLNSGPFSLGQV